MNNLHITLTPFRNESRVLKEVHAIKKHGIAQQIYIAALHEGELAEDYLIQAGTELKRFKLSTRNLPKSLFFQVLKYVEFILRVTCFYKNKNISMVNIHALSLLSLGVLLKLLYGAKLIYDTHELETETYGNNGLRKSLSKWVERLFIRYVDQIFVVSDAISKEYARMYNMPAPPVVLNCPKYTSIVVKQNLFRERLGINKDTTIFLYQGGLSESRGVHTILEVFKKTNQFRSVIVFMGYGALENEIKKASEMYSNIYHYPAVPPDEVLSFTSSADVGLSITENTCLNNYYCMPNKLFEYTMAGLPMIVSNMYEMSRFVKENKIGVVAHNESIESIIAAIDELMEMDLAVLKQNALSTARKYCWEEQEKVMIPAYHKLFGGEK